MAKIRKARKGPSSALASWAMSVAQLSFYYTNRFLLRMSRYAMKSAFGGFSSLFIFVWAFVLFVKNLFSGFIPSKEKRTSVASNCRAFVRSGFEVIATVPRYIHHVAGSVQNGLWKVKGSVKPYLDASVDELWAIKYATAERLSNVSSAASVQLSKVRLAVRNHYYRIKLGVVKIGENLVQVETRLKRGLSETFNFYTRKGPSAVVSQCQGAACLQKKYEPSVVAYTPSRTGLFASVSGIFHSIADSAWNVYTATVSRLKGLVSNKQPAKNESVILRGANEIAVRLKNTKRVILIRLTNVGYGIKSAAVHRTRVLKSSALDGVTFVTIKLQGTKDWILVRLTDLGHSVHSRADYFKEKVSTRIHDGLWRAHLTTDIFKRTAATVWSNSMGRVIAICRHVSDAWSRAVRRVGMYVTPIALAPVNVVRTIGQTPRWVYLCLMFGVIAAGYFATLILIRFKRTTYALKLPPHEKIRDGCKDFILSDSVLRQNMDRLNGQILLGLNPATKPQSSVKCWTTYVQDLPTGREKGQFLALDLGGTNFRVLLITLNGRHFDMQSKIYVVPQDIMVGTGEKLFEHIASCLDSFTKEQHVQDRTLPLGFTFSFPLQQIGLTKGVLTRWTKGFKCSGVENTDVVQGLREAANRLGINIDIVAVLNDTTGTLMSCAWKNHNCKVGVILEAKEKDPGTGTNACYVEKVTNVVDFDGDSSKPIVLINTEWGAFGDNGELEFILTPYDKDIDKHSINPGKQIHEKMISGMYLGELVRLLLVKFIHDKILFEGKGGTRIHERMSFKTEYLSEIESDPRGVFKNCRNVLGKLHINDATDQDCSNVRYICECVSRRAAHLASAAIATLLNKMDIPSVTVGVDGSLYRYHPHFHDLMTEKISQLVTPSVTNISLMLSEDGSGRGAALIAAACTKS